MIGSPFEAIEQTLRAFKLIKNDMIKLKQFLDNLQTQKQNEMKDLAKILKDGDEVYYTPTGDMHEVVINAEGIFPIELSNIFMDNELTKYGQLTNKGECLIFPSKEERNWDNFKRKEEFKKGDLCAFWDNLGAVKDIKPYYGRSSSDEFKHSSMLLKQGVPSEGVRYRHCEKINIEDYI